MKIIKKILLCSSILTPLFTFACNAKEQGRTKEPTKPIEIKQDKDEPVATQDPNSNQNIVADKENKNSNQNIAKPTSNDKIEKLKQSTEEELISQIKEIYKIIYPVYQKFTKIAVFAPKEWLKEDQYTLKIEYKQKDLDTFNENFLDKSLQPKNPENYLAKDSYMITSKEDFNMYIINRFKELNQFSDYNDAEKIKKLFEELYLENKDVYNILDNYNVVITTVRRDRFSDGAGYIIPIYDNNRTNITLITGHHETFIHYHQTDVYDPAPSVKWEVYLVKKKHAVKYSIIWRKENETLLSFRDKFVKWYKEVFKKQYQ
ncbi:hypothetical protein [Mycoplasmopsis bovirhinis]|uniref:hypothetical protein n=1 Tax=Mycoplasmopsis bovirhinis TaxID=29553 RepID=UPI000E718E10|nr:hypothetical protein [Mycoplasmopsis bovirhinis]